MSGLKCLQFFGPFFQDLKKEEGTRVSTELNFLFWSFSRRQQQIPFPWHWPVLCLKTIPTFKGGRKYRCCFFFSFFEHMDAANRIGIPLMVKRGGMDIE